MVEFVFFNNKTDDEGVIIRFGILSFDNLGLADFSGKNKKIQRTKIKISVGE